MTVSSSINWINHGEQITGQGDANDVLNRPVRDIVSKSGYASDGSDFAGFVKPKDITISGSSINFLGPGASGSLKRVSVGAPDSAGTGFRVLRIPN